MPKRKGPPGPGERAKRAATLSREQQAAVDGAIEAVSAGRTFALTGPAGSGKSRVTHEIIANLQYMGLKVYVVSARWLPLTDYHSSGATVMSIASFCCASTGEAPTARLTRHAEELLSSPEGRSKKWGAVPRAGVAVVVEEFSCATGADIDAVEAVAKQLAPQSQHLVLVGDLDQTPPIDDVPPIASNVFWELWSKRKSKEWKRVNFYALWHVHRFVDADSDWRAGVAKALQQPAADPSRVAAGRELRWQSQRPLNPISRFDLRIVATNAQVDKINREHQLKGRSSLTINPKKKKADPTTSTRLWLNGPAYVHTWDGGKIEATELHTDEPVELYNGQRGTVTRWPYCYSNRTMVVQAGVDQRLDSVEFFTNVPGRGEMTVVVSLRKAREGPIRGSFYMPLVGGGAVTVHKAQGMTVDTALIDGANFHHFGDTANAMLYVALTRSVQPPRVVNFFEDALRKPPYNTNSAYAPLLRRFYGWLREWRRQGTLQPPKPS